MTRVILDEGVPKTLARRLRQLGIDAAPFPNEWKQFSNGELLSLVERQGFQILITNDKRMQYQQSLTNRQLAILVLPTNLRSEVERLLPDIVEILPSVRAGSFHDLQKPKA